MSDDQKMEGSSADADRQDDEDTVLIRVPAEDETVDEETTNNAGPMDIDVDVVDNNDNAQLRFEAIVTKPFSECG